MAGTLFVIGTPIGNLADVTLRTLETLKGLDVLLCEDTRVTARLLDRHGIRVTLERYDEHSHEMKVAKVAQWLAEGKKIGLVSDAGTPGIADPGFRLVRDIVGLVPEAAVIPIPGPSALTAALSVSGFPSDRFLFLGFPPHKKGREAFFKEACASEETVILYESTHRIDKALESIAAHASERALCVCRELTKLHETTYRGTAVDIAAQLRETSSKGEFVVVMGPMK